MEINNPPEPAHGSDNEGRRPRGRPRGAMTRVKRELREWLWKKPEELAANIRDNALHHPDGFVRLGFSKLWAEYAYGKPLPADGENPSGPQIVRVITGVRRDPEFGNWGNDSPPSPPARPLLPDGRDPFERPPPPARPVRPVGRAPIAEPAQHRLFEGEPEGTSAPKR
jgi:hypothetical protein